MSFLVWVSKRLDTIVVEAPHNADWASAINQVIPRRDRKRVGGVWHISDRWFPAIVAITAHYFVHYSCAVKAENCRKPYDWEDAWQEHLSNVTDWTPVIDEESRRASARSQLFVTQDAPTEVVTAAYRALVKIHHPDKGGDPDRFRAIDQAYKEIVDE